MLTTMDAGVTASYQLANGRRLVVERLDEGCYRWSIMAGWEIESDATVSGDVLNNIMAATFMSMIARPGLARASRRAASR